MFKVSLRTVELLFRAQELRLRGRLRLDMSTRELPPDLGDDYDPPLARRAVGERLLIFVAGLGDDAALADLPPPRVLVMPNRDHFAFEPYHLDRLFGLVPTGCARAVAVTHLANDLHDWAFLRAKIDDLAEYDLMLAAPALWVKVEPWDGEPVAAVGRAVEDGDGPTDDEILGRVAP